MFEKKKRKKQQLPICSPLIHLSLCLSRINSTLNTFKAGRNEKGRTSLAFIKKCKEVFNKNLNFELRFQRQCLPFAALLPPFPQSLLLHLQESLSTTTTSTLQSSTLPFKVSNLLSFFLTYGLYIQFNLKMENEIL